MQTGQKCNGAYADFLAQTTPYLLDLIKQAGKKILEFYRQENLAIELKSDASPVTMADKAANAIICEGLQKFNIAIISEETPIATWQERQNYKAVWLLDPLDGTKAFVKNEAEFTVNLALICDNRPIFGIIYAPVLDEICWTQADKVYWQKNAHKQELTPHSPSQTPRIFVSKSTFNNPETQDFLADFADYRLVKASSSWKFCEIAKNNADIYPRFGTTCEWDIAAGDAILTKLGGSVINSKTLQPLLYNKEDLANPHFIAKI